MGGLLLTEIGSYTDPIICVYYLLALYPEITYIAMLLVLIITVATLFSGPRVKHWMGFSTAESA